MWLLTCKPYVPRISFAFRYRHWVIRVVFHTSILYFFPGFTPLVLFVSGGYGFTEALSFNDFLNRDSNCVTGFYVFLQLDHYYQMYYRHLFKCLFYEWYEVHMKEYGICNEDLESSIFLKYCKNNPHIFSWRKHSCVLFVNFS